MWNILKSLRPASMLPATSNDTEQIMSEVEVIEQGEPEMPVSETEPVAAEPVDEVASEVPVEHKAYIPPAGL